MGRIVRLTREHTFALSIQAHGEPRCAAFFSHCPLPIQNHELLKSGAHLVFCMRVAKSTSWPDAPRVAISRSGDGANSWCSVGILQNTQVFSRILRIAHQLLAVATLGFG